MKPFPATWRKDWLDFPPGNQTTYTTEIFLECQHQSFELLCNSLNHNGKKVTSEPEVYVSPNDEDWADFNIQLYHASRNRTTECGKPSSNTLRKSCNLNHSQDDLDDQVYVK